MSLDLWTLDPNTQAGTFPIGEMTYREDLKNSGTASLTESSSQAQRIFFVDWDQATAFIDDALGYTVYSGGGLQRVLPDEHPDYWYFYAMDAAVQPMGGKASVVDRASEWPIAKVTITYKPLKWLVKADNQVSSELDRYVERHYSQKADYLTVNSQFKFVSAPPGPDGQKTTLASSPGIITPSLLVKYTWRQIPAKISGTDPNAEMKPPNQAAILACLGKCNSVAFDKYQPQTVLFTDVDTELVLPKLRDGLFYWNITYTFEVRDNGAGIGAERAGVNYIFSTITNSYDLVTHNGEVGGVRIYAPIDLNTLFVVS